MFTKLLTAGTVTIGVTLAATTPGNAQVVEGSHDTAVVLQTPTISDEGYVTVWIEFRPTSESPDFGTVKKQVTLTQFRVADDGTDQLNFRDVATTIYYRDGTLWADSQIRYKPWEVQPPNTLGDHLFQAIVATDYSMQ